jgi:hypothetical protein
MQRFRSGAACAQRAAKSLPESSDSPRLLSPLREKHIPEHSEAGFSLREGGETERPHRDAESSAGCYGEMAARDEQAAGGAHCLLWMVLSRWALAAGYAQRQLI